MKTAVLGPRKVKHLKSQLSLLSIEIQGLSSKCVFTEDAHSSTDTVSDMQANSTAEIPGSSIICL
jgi:hypothetical protein